MARLGDTIIGDVESGWAKETAMRNDAGGRRRCSGASREAEALDDYAFASARLRMAFDAASDDVGSGALDPLVAAQAFDAARVVIESQVAVKAPLRSCAPR